MRLLEKELKFMHGQNPVIHTNSFPKFTCICVDVDYGVISMKFWSLLVELLASLRYISVSAMNPHHPSASHTV